MADLVDHDRLEALAAYADRHGLFDLFSAMVARIAIAKPAEPFQFLIDFLQKPTPAAIIVLAPPSSGQRPISEALARTFDAVHVNSGILLRSAMERQTSVGIQAKAYVERGHLVPDTIITSLVLSRLDEADVTERGFVLEGFPRTREQTIAMLRKGIIPSHTIVLEIPDDVIVSRAIGLRHDPVTGRTYHLKYDPPPRNALIESRLTRRATDTEPATRTRLDIYHRTIEAVLSCIKTNIRKFSYPNGVVSNTDAVLNDVFAFLGTRSITAAPRCHRIIVTGLPGSGKTVVAEVVEKKYGYVHVSPKKVILEEISAGSHWAKKLAPFVNAPENAPEGYLLEVISARLRKKDCVDHGWILEGFPFNKSDAEALRSKGIIPNRVIWLEVPRETCTKRLTGRRYDPLTGRIANIHAPTKDLTKTDFSTWATRAEDTENAIDTRMAYYTDLRHDLENVYGSRTSETSPGVLHVIDADGIGEFDAKREQPCLEHVLELIEGALLRPVPIEIRAQV